LAVAPVAMITVLACTWQHADDNHNKLHQPL
jgi:hypothetical protein